jgi:hypothetical protein
MESFSKLRPADEAYGDKAIWDVAINLANQRNELEDVIRTETELLQAYQNKPEATLEGISNREKKLSELRGNGLMIDDAIGELIGPHCGIVQFSPYFDQSEVADSSNETISTARHVHYVDGEERFIES